MLWSFFPSVRWLEARTEDFEVSRGPKAWDLSGDAGNIKYIIWACKFLALCALAEPECWELGGAVGSNVFSPRGCRGRLSRGNLSFPVAGDELAFSLSGSVCAFWAAAADTDLKMVLFPGEGSCPSLQSFWLGNQTNAVFAVIHQTCAVQVNMLDLVCGVILRNFVLSFLGYSSTGERNTTRGVVSWYAGFSSSSFGLESIKTNSKIARI